VKNPFKIISFLSLAALLLVSFVTFDTSESVEAVTPGADKVLFLDDSGTKITYYKTTDVAYFYINDVDLETTKTGLAKWEDLTVAVKDTSSWSIGSTVELAGTNVFLNCYYGSMRGGFGAAGTILGTNNLCSVTADDLLNGYDLAGGANSNDFAIATTTQGLGTASNLSDDNTVLSTYDSATPANTPFANVPSVKIDGTNATVDNYNSASGTWSLVEGVDVAVAATVEATIKYHLTDNYNSTTGTATSATNRAKITSTSDPVGEWVDIKEVIAYSSTAAANATAQKWSGKLRLSSDASKSAAADNFIWVQEADTLTVTFYGTDNSTVIDSHSVTVDATNPTITDILPADGSYLSTASPTLSFTLTDAESGFSTTTLGTNVAVTIWDGSAECVVNDSELTFTSVTASELQVKFSVAAAAVSAWSGAITPNCAGRVSGGFALNTTTLQDASGNSHGSEYHYTITATDKSGNIKTVTTTAGNFRIDTVAPDMLSAVTGTRWDTVLLADKTTSATDTVKVIFNESMDTATVEAADFLVDGVVPASVSIGGINDSASDCLDGAGASACFKDEYVYLKMGTDLNPDAKPKIEMVGTIKDLAGNSLKPATGKTVADTVTATDGQKPTITDELLTVKAGTLADLLDTKEETTLTWTSSEKLSGSSTVVLIAGGNSAQTTSTSNAVVMTTPTTGRFYAKQITAPFVTTNGIFGIQIKNVDLSSNSTVSGTTKVTDEDISSQITADKAASTSLDLKLAMWPVADSDGDASLLDEIAVTVNGTAMAIAATGNADGAACADVIAATDMYVTSLNYGEGETFKVCLGTALTATSIVKVTYYYANAANVVEIDTAGPTLTFDPAGGTSTEKARPYVSIVADEDEYADDTYTTVTVTKAELKSPSGVTTDISGDLSSADNKRFIYAPIADMELGQWTITARVTDTAGNKSTETTSKFTVKARAKFSLGLSAGWNLISLPNNPSSTAIDTVVGTANGVSTVYAYQDGAWKVAVREKTAGVWGAFAGSLTTMEGHKAYWVKTSDFQTLKIDIPALVGGASGSDTPPTPPTIGINVGWNMVAAVDTSGALADDADVSTVKAYLTGLTVTKMYEFTTATGTWTGYASDDAVNNVKVGRGYWVYATKAGTLVP
jgi:hypothetical protein